MGAESQTPVRRLQKPNIIFVISDQHRAGLTKREGYPLDTSPALDRLAARGIASDRAYCTSPLCVPSRTSVLTGRWPEATHVRSNEMLNDAFYPTHLYKVARKNGYKTGLAGKNHTFLSRKTPTRSVRFPRFAIGWPRGSGRRFDNGKLSLYYGDNLDVLHRYVDDDSVDLV